MSQQEAGSSMTYGQVTDACRSEQQDCLSLLEADKSQQGSEVIESVKVYQRMRNA